MSGIQIAILIPIVSFLVLGIAEYIVLTNSDRSGK